MAPSDADAGAPSRVAAQSTFVSARREVAWIDPLEAYSRLRAAGHLAFLLLGAGPHPKARWSFVATSPVTEVRIQGPQVTEVHAAGGGTETRGNVAGHLRALWDEHRHAPPDDSEDPQTIPFTGGWIGYLGYEVAHAWEPAISRHAPQDGIDDGVMHLCLDVVAFDHVRKRATLVCNDPAGDRFGLLARADALAGALQRPVPGATARVAVPPLATADRATPRTSLDEAGFKGAVEKLRSLIIHGDLFQANLATRFEVPCHAEPAAMLAALRDANPSPYMALLEYPDHAIVSGSPEQLFELRGTAIESRPIAGTRRRGADAAGDEAMEAELRTDAKEQAEHTMLVDLVRNDLARVCEPGSVAVRARMMVERYRHVMHLVSDVAGCAAPGTSAADVFASMFPGGTITGAPKVRACQRIAEAEPVPRGPYTGSAGYVSFTGDSAWNIMIRTIVLRPSGVGGRQTDAPPVAGGADRPGSVDEADDRLPPDDASDADASLVAYVHAGSGIVADSDPAREWNEAARKAQAQLAVALGAPVGGNPTRIGEVTPGIPWRPATASRRGSGARVMLVDNYDSFVHNLADYCAALGAAVRVVRNDEDWRAALADHRATHIVLGPGPGWPDEAGCTLEVARELTGRLPVLGVCLGHQAIAQAFGGKVHVHPDGPVHGRADLIHHAGGGLLRGLASPFAATRYHSLVVDCLGPEWAVDARLADGTVMALRHRQHPTYGLQFHPESLCTDVGLELLARFLEVTA